MEAITIPHIHIPSIDIGGICLPGIGVPDGGKKGLIWPKGLKESIKAVYDPASQGMTNYDVIEAYAEDFTKFIKNGNGTFTQNKYNSSITTQEWLLYKTNGKEIEAMDVYVTSDSTDRSTALRYYYYTNEDNNRKIFYLKAGLNHLPASCYKEKGSIVGFVFEVAPASEFNITITQLPTSILKDLSGNGNHAYLYGGKGKLNSGMGVYQTDFSSWIYYPSLSTVEYSPKGLVIKKVNSTAQFCASDFVGKFTAEVSGIPEGVSFYYRYIDKTTGSPVSTTLSNGINEIDCSNANGDANMTNMFLIGADNKDINITITQIPDYPDQLCYDGKMYAVCYGFPILTDYTVMAERTWFENNGNRVFITKGNIWPNCAFVFEKINASLDSETFSFSKSTRIDDLRSKSGVTYQTKQSYNGVPIAVGDSSDGDVLLIGGQKSGEYIGCHSAIIVADRSFTEEEINWLKNNLFTIDIPTPAYDFDFSKYKDGSNLGDSITDKYGNVLELHNFAWKGMSGLGGYINFPTTGNPSAASWIYDNQSITFTEIINPIASQVYTWGKNLEEIPSTKVNIIGLSNYKGAFILYRYWNGNALIAREIYNDGEYILEKGESYNNESKSGINWSIAVMNYTGKCNIKVNILPIYPGALVFDGIDDYARLAKMTIKTVVLDFVNLELDKQVYDNRDKPNNHNYFSIYPQADTVAYEARNSNGKTYINGELNTTIKTNDLLGVRCITCASNDLAKETEQYICRDSYLNNYYGKIALYRITGFTEVLTPDQVWKWYQKNKPKGGDK